MIYLTKFLLLFLLPLIQSKSVKAVSNQTIYNNGQLNWQDWSWTTKSVNYQSRNAPLVTGHSKAASISLGQWGAWSIYTPTSFLVPGGYVGLSIYLAMSPASQISFILEDTNTGKQSTWTDVKKFKVGNGVLSLKKMTQFYIDFFKLGNSGGSWNRIEFFDNAGQSPSFTLDSVILVAASTTTKGKGTTSSLKVSSSSTVKVSSSSSVKPSSSSSSVKPSSSSTSVKPSSSTTVQVSSTTPQVSTSSPQPTSVSPSTTLVQSTTTKAVSSTVTVSTSTYTIYKDSLNPGWSSWSWSTSQLLFSSTASPKIGNAAILVTTQPGAYGALSIHNDQGTLPGNLAGLIFSLSMAPTSSLVLILEANAASGSPQSQPIDVKKICGYNAQGTNTPPSTTTIIQCVVDFSTTLPVRTDWDRLNWFDDNGVGFTFTIDEVYGVTVLPSIPLDKKFTSAYLAFNRGIVLLGGGDVTGLTFKVNGVVKSFTSQQYLKPLPAKSIVQLSSGWNGGDVITVNNGSTVLFSLTAPTIQQVSFNFSDTKPINDAIYGQAFPPLDTTEVSSSGNTVTSSRWGGNAVTCYNPNGDFTNAAVSWYFENRASDNAKAWMSSVKNRGKKVFLTVPALDWVAKDATCYSYPKTKFPSQSGFDPWKPDAGSGRLPDGTVLYTDQGCFVPWNQTSLGNWLRTFTIVPEFIAVDNEMDIAGTEHSDMHPGIVGYDEIVLRVKQTALTVKQFLPGTLVTGPASCCWYFYWNSQLGQQDKTKYGDFLPYFLDRMKAEGTAAGKRLLDVLDIHYYPDSFGQGSDTTAQALRLRSTRSLWDPTYTDESWIATDGSNNQPNPHQVQLIPRMQKLIRDHYPGTLLGLNEYNWGSETTVDGGLALADVLGILGKFGVDQAHYWTSPNTGTPAALAFWIYKGGVGYGNQYVGNMLTFDANLEGVYSSRNVGESGVSRMVIVNKSPTFSRSYRVGLMAGMYEIRYFGRDLGLVANVVNLCFGADEIINVPAYSVVGVGYVGTC